MQTLPTDTFFEICSFLDCTATVALSRCSKTLYILLSTQEYWRKLFDLHFSIEWLNSESVKNWKKKFRKVFKIHNRWKHQQDREKLTTGISVAILGLQTCGKIKKEIEHLPGFPKYLVQLAEVRVEKRANPRSNPSKYAILTETTTLFPGFPTLWRFTNL